MNRCDEHRRYAFGTMRANTITGKLVSTPTARCDDFKPSNTTMCGGWTAQMAISGKKVKVYLHNFGEVDACKAGARLGLDDMQGGRWRQCDIIGNEAGDGFADRAAVANKCSETKIPLQPEFYATERLIQTRLLVIELEMASRCPRQAEQKPPRAPRPAGPVKTVGELEATSGHRFGQRGSSMVCQFCATRVAPRKPDKWLLSCTARPGRITAWNGAMGVQDVPAVRRGARLSSTRPPHSISQGRWN